MPFNDLITRGDAYALIPQETSREVIKLATSQSAVLSLCRRAQMGSADLQMPVLSSLPSAYWVSGDTGLKRVARAQWDGVQLKAAEVAVIIPIPENVMNDSAVDVWGELQPSIAEQFASVLDAACLAGIDRPSEFPESIIEQARAAGQVVQAGASPTEGGVIGDLGSLLGEVEDLGYEPTGWVAARRLRGLMRRARDTGGQLLGEMDLSKAWSLPFTWAINGTLPTGVLALAGDFNAAIVGVRQDLMFKMFTEGVITDEDGTVVLNLMQQDSVAMRVTARYAFQTARPVTVEGHTGLPFAVLEAAGGGSEAASAARRTPATKK
jgi:HK97 family phage major capsid protein